MILTLLGSLASKITLQMLGWAPSSTASTAAPPSGSNT